MISEERKKHLDRVEAMTQEEFDAFMLAEGYGTGWKQWKYKNGTATTGPPPDIYSNAESCEYGYRWKQLGNC